MPKLSESTPCSPAWIRSVEDLINRIDEEKHVRNLPALLDESKLAFIRLLDTRSDPELVWHQESRHVTTRIVNHPVFDNEDDREDLNIDTHLDGLFPKGEGWELLQVENADRVVDGRVVRTPVYIIGQTRDTVMSALRANEEKLIKDLLQARAELVQVKGVLPEEPTQSPESVKLLETLETISSLESDKKNLIGALHRRDKRIVELSDALARFTNPGPKKARKPEPATPPDEGAVDLVAEFLLNFMQTFNRHSGKQKS